jgi:hypothetical protein
MALSRFWDVPSYPVAVHEAGHAVWHIAVMPRDYLFYILLVRTRREVARGP